MSKIIEYKVENQTIPIHIKTQNRKTLQLTLDSTIGFIAKAPSYITTEHLQSFLAEHKEWLLKYWLQYRDSIQKKEIINRLNQSSILYLGKRYKKKIVIEPTKRESVRMHEDALIVTIKKEENENKQIEKWYRTQAKALISGRLEIYRSQMDLTYQNLTIKDTKTRWASCSSQGNLNFSWRLVLTPLHVLDYVIVHELAHLIEMNHSSRFWNIVESYYPEYKKAMQWLKDNHDIIKAIG